jgi:hypothetical protein
LGENVLEPAPLFLEVRQNQWNHMDKHKNYFDFKGKNAEKFVHELALKTFLTDWCYLNPKLPNGKELCDLLVVFDEIAIIWQVKDLKLDHNGKYNESEVQKNLRQLSGAQRQLFDLKTPIKLKNPRRRQELFNPAEIKQIYSISVFLGQEEEVFPLVEIVKKYTVHIFTRNCTNIILSELDTISDFVKYLKEKENLINTDKTLVITGGEEELLAFYLLNDRSFKRFENADNIFIEQGAWEHIQNKPEYKLKKKADEISYGWDSIIDRVHEGSPKYETVARELARPNRFMRRYLSKVFFEAYVQAHEDKEHDLYRRILLSQGTTYCFLFQDDPDPRERRRSMLGAICYIARGMNKQNAKVIGIATEKTGGPDCSYDFCLMNIPEWTEECQTHMEKLQKETGIFVNPIIGRTTEDEYPSH